MFKSNNKYMYLYIFAYLTTLAKLVYIFKNNMIFEMRAHLPFSSVFQVFWEVGAFTLAPA